MSIKILLNSVIEKESNAVDQLTNLKKTNLNSSKSKDIKLNDNKIRYPELS